MNTSYTVNYVAHRIWTLFAQEVVEGLTKMYVATLGPVYSSICSQAEVFIIQSYSSVARTMTLWHYVTEPRVI